uniref:Uncharacterized protein n=1 Tax=Arundo donax TaxID=35708 RepID=A0A0A9EW24_ARUDO
MIYLSTCRVNLGNFLSGTAVRESCIPSDKRSNQHTNWPNVPKMRATQFCSLIICHSTPVYAEAYNFYLYC